MCLCERGSNGVLEFPVSVSVERSVELLVCFHCPFNHTHSSPCLYSHYINSGFILKTTTLWDSFRQHYNYYFDIFFWRCHIMLWNIFSVSLLQTDTTSISRMPSSFPHASILKETFLLVSQRTFLFPLNITPSIFHFVCALSIFSCGVLEKVSSDLKST